MKREPACWVVEDEIGKDLMEVLLEFKGTGLRGLFKVLYLGRRADFLTIRSNLGGIACISSPLEDDHGNVSDWVVEQLRRGVSPDDLVVVDHKLDNIHHEARPGPDLLRKALREGRSENSFQELREELQVVSITQYPDIVARTFPDFVKLARALTRDVLLIEKVGDFHARLTATIDDWRVRRELTGSTPGPLLRGLLAGDREISFRFQPLVDLKAGMVWAHAVLPQDSHCDHPDTAIEDAAQLGGERRVELDRLATEGLRTWRLRADEVVRSGRFVVPVSVRFLSSTEDLDRLRDAGSSLSRRSMPLTLVLDALDLVGTQGLDLESTAAGLAARGVDLGVRVRGLAEAEAARALCPSLVVLPPELVAAWRAKGPTAEVRSLLALCRELRATVLAEGVDGNFQADTLASLVANGVGLARGSLFGRSDELPRFDLDERASLRLIALGLEL